MKTPSIILALFTVVSLIVAIATSVSADSARREAYFGNTVAAERATDLAALSNSMIVFTGVGFVGLLVAWAVWGAVQPKTS